MAPTDRPVEIRRTIAGAALFVLAAVAPAAGQDGGRPAAGPQKERPAGRDLGEFTVTAHPIEVLDANPAVTGKPVAELSARDVGGLDVVAAGRQGAAADGVSALLLRVPVAGGGQLNCTVEGGEKNGRCAALAVRPSPPVSGFTTAVAIYHPPASFGPDAGSIDADKGVETRKVTLNLSLDRGGGAQTAAKQIDLARPPLILVHGTFSSPQAWTGTTGGQSFLATVTDAGFKAFTLDYTGSFLTTNLNQGSFEENKQTLWVRPGGIAEAVDHFRNRMKYAATKADVVGHSLGGLIARIYASPHYKDEAHPYKRPDNFDAGDINRLVTLCAPHHGSVMSALLDTFHQTGVANSGVVSSALAGITLFVQRWWNGINTDGGAVRDQIPQSPALDTIGATPGYDAVSIPAFAVGCVASDEDADDFVMDPEGEYRSIFNDLSWLFYNAPAALELYLKNAGLEKEAAQLPWVLDAAYQTWLIRNAEVSWLTGPPPGLKEELNPAQMAELQALFRAFVFLYDKNDFTVGLTSQHGSLEEQHRADLEGVLHGPAPRYPSVQQFVVGMLKEQSPDGKTFRAAGFPPAGQKVPPAAPSKELIARLSGLANQTDVPLPNDPRNRVITLANLIHSKAYVWGEEAIRWSGVVHPHAIKFMSVAERSKTVFMFRPVNPDSTALIAGNASTKPMAIKAKSADWGPHRGLLAADQAFSKKAGAGAATIAKFNCDAYDNLIDHPGELAPAKATGVKAVPYVRQIDGRPYELVRTGASSGLLADYQCRFDPEKKKFVPTEAFADTLARRLPPGYPPLLLRGKDADGKEEFRTLDDAPAPDTMPPEEVLPFLVFANPDGQYMTADYDLLAIGSLTEVCENPPFDETYGAACSWQIPLIRRLNKAAGSGACKYTGGDLVHHGPETQYTGSEYVDYPVLAIIPGVDWAPSRMVAVRQGPDGYRDMHLKRLFFMLQQQGWKIDPNPKAVGWRWGPANPFTGYELADQTTFPPDVPAEIVPPAPPLKKYCEF